MNRRESPATCASLLRRVLVTDRVQHGGLPGLVEQIALRATQWQASLVILREKDLPDETLLDLARRLRANTSTALVLAHRADLARDSGLAGVHLGWNSIAVEEARRILGCQALVGISVHSVAEGLQRAAEQPDYMMLGPIRATPSKEGLVRPVGFQALGELARECKLPLVAIGGLDRSDEETIRQTGAAGWAAIRSFAAAPRESADS